MALNAAGGAGAPVHVPGNVTVVGALGALAVSDMRSALVLQFLAGMASAPLSTLAFMYMLETLSPKWKMQLALPVVLAVTALGTPLARMISPALMEGAVMNVVNDSAPLHIAGAVNAPVTAIFCSTVPAFGFGPLRANGRLVETTEKLDCRPCGLHGHRVCPKGHFRCAEGIEVRRVLGA